MRGSIPWKRWGVPPSFRLRLVLLAAVAYLGLECALGCSSLLPVEALPAGPAGYRWVQASRGLYAPEGECYPYHPSLWYPYDPYYLGWVAPAVAAAYVAAYRRSYLPRRDQLQLYLAAPAVGLALIVMADAWRWPGPGVTGLAERLLHEVNLCSLAFTWQLARAMTLDPTLISAATHPGSPLSYLLLAILFLLPGFLSGLLISRRSSDVRLEAVVGVGLPAAVLAWWTSRSSDPVILVPLMKEAFPWACAVAAQVLTAMLGGLVGRGVHAAVARRRPDEEPPEKPLGP